VLSLSPYSSKGRHGEDRIPLLDNCAVYRRHNGVMNPSQTYSDRTLNHENDDTKSFCRSDNGHRCGMELGCLALCSLLSQCRVFVIVTQTHALHAKTHHHSSFQSCSLFSFCWNSFETKKQTNKQTTQRLIVLIYRPKADKI
jgi:hypothetical protein